MELKHDQCYEIIKAKDARFDGMFYTAVKTTGIYCRPICKVPEPKSENCTFYKTAAQAELNGYRPCLRCRPELAPNYSEFAQGTELMTLILTFFEDHNYRPGLIEACSHALGISSRHINRLFHQELGVSPKNFIMTKRLLRAKALLTDTNIPITELAMQAGFGSISRFNASIKKRYRLTPSEIRKTKKTTRQDDFIQCRLSYRPPYDWEQMLAFYALRAVPGVEVVSTDSRYQRSIIIEVKGKIYKGWIEISPDTKDYCLSAKISQSLEDVIMIVIGLIKKAFDLDAMPSQLPADLPKGIRLPGCFNMFEMSVRAILGQQITVKAATTIAGRLVDELGEDIETPFEGVNKLFPMPSIFLSLGDDANEVLGKLGVIQSRTRSILGIAQSILEGKLANNLAIDDYKRNLVAIKGVGAWTAEYLTMRGRSWPDAFPVTDIAVKKAILPYLNDDNGALLSENTSLSPYRFNKLYEKYALIYSEEYQPWRSYLTLALWQGAQLKGSR